MNTHRPPISDARSWNKDNIVVLLIEDSHSDAELIARLLTDSAAEQIKCVLAGELSAGLAIIEQSTIDLVVLDLGLPDSTGLATLTRVVESAPRIPVVVLTGTGDLDVAYEALHQGAQDYLVKGQVSKDLLLRSIRHALTRKVDENQLVEREEMYRTLVETSPESITLCDLEGNIIKANQQAADLLGYDLPEEIVGKNSLSSIAPEDREQATEALKEVLRTGMGKRGTGYRLVRRDGSYCAIEVSSSAIRGPDGAPTGFMAVTRDVSYKKELESQLLHAHKLEAIGQLAAGIAHEINTPIQYVGDNTAFLQVAFTKLTRALEGCRGLVEEAKSGTPGQPAVDGAARALKKAKVEYLLKQVPRAIEQSLDGLDRVAQIVLAMKEFSHPNPGEKEPVDLHKAIETTLTVARNEWKYVADIEYDFDPDLPQIPCLRDEFNQVVLNLVVNAAHAIGDTLVGDEPGKGTIGIKTTHDEYWAAVQVSDTGPGIPQEIRDKIFEPFFTTKKVGKGTGQGLAIARSVIVEKHGGELLVESTMGQGTTFTVRLPLCVASS